MVERVISRIEMGKYGWGRVYYIKDGVREYSIGLEGDTELAVATRFMFQHDTPATDAESVRYGDTVLSLIEHLEFIHDKYR